MASSAADQEGVRVRGGGGGGERQLAAHPVGLTVSGVAAIKPHSTKGSLSTFEGAGRNAHKRPCVLSHHPKQGPAPDSGQRGQRVAVGGGWAPGSKKAKLAVLTALQARDGSGDRGEKGQVGAATRGVLSRIGCLGLRANSDSDPGERVNGERNNELIRAEGSLHCLLFTARSVSACFASLCWFRLHWLQYCNWT
jgi:hypothetical protein